MQVILFLLESFFIMLIVNMPLVIVLLLYCLTTLLTRLSRNYLNMIQCIVLRKIKKLRWIRRQYVSVGTMNGEALSTLIDDFGKILVKIWSTEHNWQCENMIEEVVKHFKAWYRQNFTAPQKHSTETKEYKSVTAHKWTQSITELLVGRLMSNSVGSLRLLLPLTKTFGY